MHIFTVNKLNQLLDYNVPRILDAFKTPIYQKNQNLYARILYNDIISFKIFGSFTPESDTHVADC